MSWFYLFVAGIFEIAWAISMKYSLGFTKIWPTLITIVTMGLSIFFLSLALKDLPLGTAYAVWTGIGVLGTSILGIFIFDESFNFLRLLFLFLLISSIVGLKLTAAK